MIRPHPPHNSPVLGITTAFLAVVSLCAGGGCSRSIDATPGTTLEAWPWRPVSVRIHPLTRFRTMPGGEGRGVEARIELRDSDGYACRGVGAMTLHITNNSEVRVFSRHTLNLADASDNSQRFDDVTRTYIAHIDLSTHSELPDVLVLHAHFQTPAGAAMTDQMRIDVEP